jgi:hypothetical protein
MSYEQQVLQRFLGFGVGGDLGMHLGTASSCSLVVVGTIRIGMVLGIAGVR